MQREFLQWPHLNAQADLGTGIKLEQHITRKQKKSVNDIYANFIDFEKAFDIIHREMP